MTVETKQSGQLTIVTVAGRMDAEGASVFEEACIAAIREGSTQLLIDLGGLQYVSSMGLQSFLAVAKAIQQKGGRLMLCRMTGMVKEVFDTAHLTPLFPVFASTEEALDSL